MKDLGLSSIASRLAARNQLVPKGVAREMGPLRSQIGSAALAAVNLALSDSISRIGDRYRL